MHRPCEHFRDTWRLCASETTSDLVQRTKVFKRNVSAIVERDPAGPSEYLAAWRDRMMMSWELQLGSVTRHLDNILRGSDENPRVTWSTIEQRVSHLAAVEALLAHVEYDYLVKVREHVASLSQFLGTQSCASLAGFAGAAASKVSRDCL